MIMDGNSKEAGAVGCLKRIKNAIGVARKVMEETYHTILAGEDATRFAIEMGFPQESLTTNASYTLWKNWMDHGRVPNYWKHGRPTNALHNSSKLLPKGHDTIGMLAIDKFGNIACGTSTNGLTFKIPGRVGDSPIVGAGAYCDSDVGAASGTGDGDVMMRFLPSFAAVTYMRMGKNVLEACNLAMQPIGQYFPKFSGALICLAKNGSFAAARYGLKEFPFSIQNINMQDAQVVTV
jgi:N4-(beta-N-acetylglucosaminyl)-L-asparaginase